MTRLTSRLEPRQAERSLLAIAFIDVLSRKTIPLAVPTFRGMCKRPRGEIQVTFHRLYPCALILFACSIGWTQQFRLGSPQPVDLSKAAIERHLQSKHPKIPDDASKPTPGKYLLERPAARAKQLQSRIRSAAAHHLRPQSSQSSILPGIQFRAALPGGSLATSVVAGDFNRDGHMDFVVANGGTNDLWIYLGNGDGTFQSPQSSR